MAWGLPCNLFRPIKWEQTGYLLIPSWNLKRPREGENGIAILESWQIFFLKNKASKQTKEKWVPTSKGKSNFLQQRQRGSTAQLSSSLPHIWNQRFALTNVYFYFSKLAKKQKHRFSRRKRPMEVTHWIHFAFLYRVMVFSKGGPLIQPEHHEESITDT